MLEENVSIGTFIHMDTPIAIFCKILCPDFYGTDWNTHLYF